MAKIKRPRPPVPEISQASVADVAFLLLVFFIATTTFETEYGIPVLLPGMEGKAVKVKRENVITVRAAADGMVYIESVPVSLRDVRTRVRTELDLNDQLIVTIETDGDAAYQQMVDVLDEVKAAGAPRFSIRKRIG
ncbi:MAG: biopolymer transporter ExbD [Candidatus Eisenbacteria bacterium]|uniref:Biopolymer transporter ExbD n=1 Tax=Eiseniibacteriota bacterium TaxID=2212470 RepID=A0A938BPP0_UNCEI|nr:biopolymer transporter ExbD [Candidatus Eisenbacteria bacterium]